MGTVVRQTLAFGFFCLVFLYNQLFFACFFSKKTKAQTFCYASVIWSILLFLITESLSIFNAINGKMLFASWSFILAVEIIITVRKQLQILKEMQQGIRNVHDFWMSIDWLSKSLLTVIIFFMARAVAMAVITVPNNWDSMTYHLSRMAFWLEHGNVNYFATNIPRQLYSPVFAEYINLHVMGLCHGDLFVNLLQTFSGIGTSVLIYFSARKLNISKKMSLFAVLLIQGMYIFIAESFSTQVDIVAAFYFAAAIYLLIDYLCSEKKDQTYASHWLPIGVISGILYITKTNICISAAIMIIGSLVIDLISRKRIISQLFRCIAVGIPALIVSFPTFLRNYFYVNDPLASKYMGGIAVGTSNIIMLLVNLLKNIGNCIVTSWYSEGYVSFVEKISQAFSINIDAREISYSTPYKLPFSYHMDYAGAPLLTVLIVLGVLGSIVLAALKHNKWFFFNLLLNVQLIAMLTIVRWQPWATRLFLPALIPATISIVYCLAELKRLVKTKSNYKTFAQIGNIAIASIMFITLADSGAAFAYHEGCAREYITGQKSRFESYFARGGNVDAYKNLCNEIDEREHRSIGLYTGSDSYQYPILSKYSFNGSQVENIVEFEANKYAPMDFKPNIVIMLNKRLEEEETLQINGTGYKRIYVYPGDSAFSLWEKI